MKQKKPSVRGGGNPTPITVCNCNEAAVGRELENPLFMFINMLVTETSIV